jgi:hypothetical protein
MSTQPKPGTQPAPPKRIYWHRELPPLALRIEGEHVLEATSDPILLDETDPDRRWALCIDSLMASVTRRLEQEIYGVPHHEVDTSSCWKPLAIRVWDRAS